MTDQKEGRLYSEAYIERGKPTADSATMRRRLAALFDDMKDMKQFEAELPKKLGVDVRYHHWAGFFKDADIVVVLNTITVAYRYLVAKRSGPMYDPSAANKFAKEVATIFAEENVGYRIDSQGGVHPLVDPEFEANRQAAIAALNGSRYSNALDGIDKAHSLLSEIPPNGKDAIRNTFAAAEGLFKLMFPKEPRLDAGAVKKQLPAVVQRAYADNSAAVRSASRLINSFAEWIESAHHQRHEQGTEEVAQPPFELAVNLISLGNSFVRWLAEMDAMTREDQQH
jgi:hypothetical protein